MSNNSQQRVDCSAEEDEFARQTAERKSNFLILRSLESRVSASLFAQILSEVQSSMPLPERTKWDGKKSQTSYEELSGSHTNLNSDMLIQMVAARSNLENTTSKRRTSAAYLQTIHRNKLGQNALKNQSIDQQKSLFWNNNIRGKLSCRLNTPGAQASERDLLIQQFVELRRMKTVFCHANFQTDEIASVFNVQFDKTGKFIVSGADDGILKIWDRDTLNLQASLQGHDEYITILDISKCNRFIASAGKDTQVVIWDLAQGKIIKRLKDHTQMVNRISFFTIKAEGSANPSQDNSKGAKLASRDPRNGRQSKAAETFQMKQEMVGKVGNSFKTGQQGAENQKRKIGPQTYPIDQQFLISCSDDGQIFLYDISPLNRIVSPQQVNNDVDVSKSQLQNGDLLEEFTVRRSGRRQHENFHTASTDYQNEPNADLNLFSVNLVHGLFRPGSRNKKLDHVACSSAGIVVAGSSTGELMAWKLDLKEIARKNAKESANYIGQFKVCKNTGVQHLEFAPDQDLLMSGSTDGTVKIWDLNLPKNAVESEEKIENFDMTDNSLLIVSIDEREGCQKAEPLKYFDESGEEQYDYKLCEVKPSIVGPSSDKLNIYKSQCDAVKWSSKGRYAIMSITTKIKNNQMSGLVGGNGVNSLPGGDEQGDDSRESGENLEEVCRIKIWDTLAELFIDDLAKPSGKELKKNSWVLAPHPIIEELLLTGSDGGSLILWNIERQQILKSFSQYGVYSIDGKVSDNPLDGHFSPDGKCLIVGNQLGTISLYSCEDVEHQYEGTRVQQFFMIDSTRDTNNPFQNIQNRPQICGYNMIPYEAQPERALIGKFAQAEYDESATTNLNFVDNFPPSALLENGGGHLQIDENLLNKKGLSKKILQEKAAFKSKVFQRKVHVANEMGSMEEKYYQDQLQMSLEENNSMNNRQAQIGGPSDLRRQGRNSQAAGVFREVQGTSEMNLQEDGEVSESEEEIDSLEDEVEEALNQVQMEQIAISPERLDERQNSGGPNNQGRRRNRESPNLVARNLFTSNEQSSRRRDSGGRNRQISINRANLSQNEANHHLGTGRRLRQQPLGQQNSRQVLQEELNAGNVGVISESEMIQDGYISSNSENDNRALHHPHDEQETVHFSEDESNEEGDSYDSELDLSSQESLGRSRRQQPFRVGTRRNMHDQQPPSVTNRRTERAQRRSQRRHTRHARGETNSDASEDEEEEVSRSRLRLRRVVPTAQQMSQNRRNSAHNASYNTNAGRRSSGRRNNQPRHSYEESPMQSSPEHLLTSRQISRNGGRNRRVLDSEEQQINNGVTDESSSRRRGRGRPRLNQQRMENGRENTTGTTQYSTNNGAAAVVGSSSRNRNQNQTGQNRRSEVVVHQGIAGECIHRNQNELEACEAKFQENNTGIFLAGVFISDRDDNDNFSEGFESDNPKDTKEKSKQKVRFVSGSEEPDRDYEFISEPKRDLAKFIETSKYEELLGNAECSFCQKKDQELIGPFCKFEKDQQSGEKMNIIGEPLWFHLQCVEKNNFSLYDQESQSWLNIGLALQNLRFGKQIFKCNRCNLPGATVQCFDCNAKYHGHFCGELYMINVDTQAWQCIFCRNKQNYKENKQKKDLIIKLAEDNNIFNYFGKSQEYYNKLSQMDKSHLLTSESYEQYVLKELRNENSETPSYVPQVNDLVYYFFQGHENYLMQQSLHFFAGQKSKFELNRKMPFLNRKKKLMDQSQTICLVEKVQALCPSQRSLELIEQYGDVCTQVTQNPHFILRTTLVVIQNYKIASKDQENAIRFQVDLFPTSLPDFLVPIELYEKRLVSYRSKVLNEEFVGKTFPVLIKGKQGFQKMKILSDKSPLEEKVAPQSLWQNIRCVEANLGQRDTNQMPSHRSRSVASPNNQNQSISEEDVYRVSFWEINFDGPESSLGSISKSMNKFRDTGEAAQLLNNFQGFIDKEIELSSIFLERVDESVRDYRAITPGEMYFQLIMDRIKNGYYRTQDSLYHDVDLISYNAKIYNGEDHEITTMAMEVCEKLRINLKKWTWRTNDDKDNQQRLDQSRILHLPPKKLPNNSSDCIDIEYGLQQEIEKNEGNQISIGLVKIKPKGNSSSRQRQKTTSSVTIDLDDEDNEEEKLDKSGQKSKKQTEIIEIESGRASTVKLNVSAKTKQKIQNEQMSGRKRTRMTAAIPESLQDIDGEENSEDKSIDQTANVNGRTLRKRRKI